MRQIQALCLNSGPAPLPARCSVEPWAAAKQRANSSKPGGTRTSAACWPREAAMAASTMRCARGRCSVRVTVTSRLRHCGMQAGAVGE